MVSLISSAPKAPPTFTAPTAKALPRRGQLAGTVRKRDESEHDMDSDARPSSPKRSKVAFDPDVEVRIMGEWEKTLELVRAEVRRGIEQHSLGDNAGYDQLKMIFSTSATSDEAFSPTTMRNYTLALTGNVSLLDRSCSGLVHAILHCDWLGRDEAFVALYVRFLGNLVSAQAVYVSAALKMLVGHLSNLHSSAGRLPNHAEVRLPQLFSRAHAALKYLLRLIPSASGALAPILASAFPHPSDSKRAHITFVQNLLTLIDYAPELRSEVLALITERLVKIDVQVQADLEDLEEDVEEGLVEDVSQRGQMPSEEAEDSDDSDDESVSSDDSLDEEAQRIKEVKSNVSKMDSILDVLFSYYSTSFSPSSPSADPELAFDLLLNHFATIILPTYRSRHTQFLLFHFAQTSPYLIDQFAGACVHLAFDKGRPAILKQSAAAYLASFVARGAHVPPHIVRDVFDLIGTHLDGIRLEHEASCRGPDLRRYTTFYAMVQALLYIFCFRWRDLLVHPNDDTLDQDHSYNDDDDLFADGNLTWAPGIKTCLTNAIYSKFNPLKICSPPIVTEFARIANHLRFLYVFPLLEKNKRLRLTSSSSLSSSSSSMPSTQVASTTMTTSAAANAAKSTQYAQQSVGRESALSVRKDESWLLLDAYFPFDPYLLPRSRRWVEGDYVAWRGVPGLDDGDGDGEASSESEGEGEGEKDGSETEGDD
ncbi:MAG: hypothetical protein M1819_002869 [Sarea resinae]|nr:MAG: hypothetical protein M1819_002869 [Sarea resinae]